MAYDEYKHAGADEYKFIQMTDIDEQQPDAVLKGAEYVEYLGLYFNREKEASAAIQHMRSWPPSCSRATPARTLPQRRRSCAPPPLPQSVCVCL